MRPLASLAVGLAALADVANSHISLFYPNPIGKKSSDQPIFPCGNFDPNSRNGATTWSLAGHTIEFLSTHDAATYTFKMAKLPCPGGACSWFDITPTWTSTGTAGWVCFQYIPGYPSFSGSYPINAVLQIRQVATDSTNHVVRFSPSPSRRCGDETRGRLGR